jgi:ABC-2 type transport system ATP-binding protein
VIEVESLTKRYGLRTAVDGISFSVGKGEIVGFLGPNGAGKSTTLRMLTGFLAPSAGTIRIDGIDMQENPIEARRRIGYMPEACPLYPEMRVVEYLRYRAELKGVPSRDIGKRVDTSLAQASVTEVASRIIGQLSKGTRQRVGIADALVADPPLLVLDEPTAGLDPNQIRQVRDLIKSFAKTKTVLLSTHILPEVEASCERVVIIHKGKVVQTGAPDELRASSRRGRGRAFVLRSKSPRDALEAALDGVDSVQSVTHQTHHDGDAIHKLLVVTSDAPDAAEAIFTAVARAGLTLRELTETQGASLEDVFSLLTRTDAAKADASDDEDDAPTAGATTDGEAEDE